MSNYSTRPSRDGDQFHYLWAARRCLRLLSPATDLVAIAIEGASTAETAAGNAVEAGEELIDVAEYYGSENIADSTGVRYIQLKHSTQHPAEPWPPSGLEKTLKGFAERYAALKRDFGTDALAGKLEFCFITNRPINTDFLETVDDAAQGAAARHAKNLHKLETYTGFNGPALSAFCKLLRLEGSQDGCWDQRNILVQETSGYLPDADMDAPVQLKELVTRKALSENRDAPTITKTDVLRALQTDEYRLFPAPCLLKETESAIPREQEANLIEQIIQADKKPTVIHAEGGVGKSVFATRIKLGLPTGSKCVVYDCFGNGQYRSASAYRHRHKDALVQIANELAASGLCHPLIPTSRADSADYARVFRYRMQQSITSLRAEQPDALLCIVIDAADNAQMAAEEIGESRAFVRDLLRETLPDGVRLVMLCRTHRQPLLDPPPQALRLELQPFSRAETAVHLRQRFPEATEHDVDEFHHLSSHNPRVQATVLASNIPLPDMLRALGPNPTTVDDTLADLLEHAVAELRDKAGVTEKSAVDLICAGLAVLRPLVPISILAVIAKIDEAAVKSFALDLGRPLIVIGETLQFFDEPAETWFRERFKPKAEQFKAFIETLQPLAASSAYVASALPQLMLEAAQFTELVDLALTSAGLPEANPIERRDVELQRLQFALKASLRAQRYTDAAKLALKAGGETAGDERQQKLLQENTDLASAFLDADRIQKIVSRRTFGGGWLGSHHVYEAGLMSGRNELKGDARSRLRMAYDWLRNWSRLPKDQREDEKIEDQDIAELAVAHFNIHGADKCAYELRRWKPREISFRAGRILAKRFVDHGRYQDLNRLALAAGNDLGLILAITLELRKVLKNPPVVVVERALLLISSPGANLQNTEHWNHDRTPVQAVTMLVEAVCRLFVGDREILAALLVRYLPDEPPRGIASRFDDTRLPLLRAYTLHAALVGRRLEAVDLAHPELRNALEKQQRHQDSEEVREFKQNVEALLPWYQLWAKAITGPISADEISLAIAETKSLSSKSEKFYYRDESYATDEIARLWLEILILTGNADNQNINQWREWIASLNRSLYASTLIRISRLTARTEGLESLSLEYAGKAFSLVRDERGDAEEKADTYVDLARAVLAVSKPEATEYFNQAVEVASKIGDENLSRWTAIVNLAERAANLDRPNSEIAYKFARCAELTYDYVVRDKHFDWEATVGALAALCSSSSLAILSRWRDRNFGWIARLLPIVIQSLLKNQRIDSKAALALISFRANWDQADLLKHVLSAAKSPADKQIAWGFLYRYMRLEGQTASVWRKAKAITAEHGLSIDDIDELITFSEREEQSKHRKEAYYNRGIQASPDEKEKPDWRIIFSGVDLTTVEGISQAHLLFNNAEYKTYRCHFFEQVCKQVRAGQEVDFIKALPNSTKFDPYSLREFLEHIPEAWKSRLAVKSAIAEVVKIFCRRYCLSISKYRYHQVPPFETVCALSGLTEIEIIDVALSAIGEVTEIVGAERLFNLVGLLAPKLNDTQATEALSFGLGLFENTLEESDGDGPWSAALMPPATTDEAVAGYIWAALGAPQAALRWEAAHAVRALCTLDWKEVLDKLINFGKGATAGPFTDAKLHFYHRHAHQWLLIALARAAVETPAVLASYGEFFLHFALHDAPHVLIRRFAATAALALANNQCLQLDPTTQTQLLAVNASAWPAIASRRYERCRHVHPMHRESGAKAFQFDYDMARYWFENLGDCFAKTSTEIEELAGKVVNDNCRLAALGDWDKDERVRRKIYEYQDTRYSRGSYPRTDDLRFYLSYHAMMTVAGQLLATTPLHQDADYSDDEFGDWLARHGLSRDDNRWLADRRDPVPLDWPGWKDEEQDDHWRWSLRREDFDRILGLPGDRLNLWGQWVTIEGSRKESVYIYSALVSSEQSEALLRALQSVADPNGYCIPAADDDSQIAYGKFRLKGWINASNHSTRLDEFDPWAGNIDYPPLRPAKFVVDLMQLGADPEYRLWHIQSSHNQPTVLWSQSWGHFHEKDDETEKENGRRLQASFGFITELLGKIGMDLIIKVSLQRRISYSRYENRNKDEPDYIPNSTRLFLIKADGNIHTL